MLLRVNASKFGSKELEMSGCVVMKTECVSTPNSERITVDQWDPFVYNKLKRLLFGIFVFN